MTTNSNSNVYATIIAAVVQRCDVLESQFNASVARCEGLVEANKHYKTAAHEKIEQIENLKQEIQRLNALCRDQKEELDYYKTVMQEN